MGSGGWMEGGGVAALGGQEIMALPVQQPTGACTGAGVTDQLPGSLGRPLDKQWAAPSRWRLLATSG